MRAQLGIDTTTIQQIEPTLLRYAQRAVGSEELAKDLVQETWITALSSLSSFEGRAALSSWMVTILRRKVIDHWRRARPQDELDEESLSSREPVLDDKLQDGQMMAQVHAALAALPPLEAEAVRQCDVQQRDRDDAAAFMGISRSHLRVLLHRGRHRIRRAVTAAHGQ